jgi:hypothetical protein
VAWAAGGSVASAVGAGVGAGWQAASTKLATIKTASSLNKMSFFFMVLSSPQKILSIQVRMGTFESCFCGDHLLTRRRAQPAQLIILF